MNPYLTFNEFQDPNIGSLWNLLKGGNKISFSQLANPGAGNEFSILPPSGKLWVLNSLRFTFDPQVAVATRRVNIVSQYNGTNLGLFINPNTQILGQVYTYFTGSFNSQIQNESPNFVLNVTGFNNKNIFAYNDGANALSVRSSTTNRQPTDIFSNIFFSYQEFNI